MKFNNPKTIREWNVSSSEAVNAPSLEAFIYLFLSIYLLFIGSLPLTDLQESSFLMEAN